VTCSDRHALEFLSVGKTFTRGGRRVVGLAPLTLDVERGEAVALTGPNGVGKSTALRIVATLTVPTTGRASVCGHDVLADAPKVRRSIGVSLGSARSFYWRLTARHNLLLFGALNGMPRRAAVAAVEHVAAELDLCRWLALPAGRLSRGTLARLSVARALLHDPLLIVLDEPFVSVDDAGRDLVWSALENRMQRGRAVALASHDACITARCDTTVRLDGPAAG
jgi:ABC-2 type transport system ATP-binding protein